MTKGIINLGYSASKSIATHTGPFVKNFMDGMETYSLPNDIYFSLFGHWRGDLWS